MKQYKLRKWYPSLPRDWEVGMLVGQGDDRGDFGDYSPVSGQYAQKRLNWGEVEKSVEFWKRGEVKQKEYEILEFRSVNDGSTLKLDSNGTYSCVPLEEMLNGFCSVQDGRFEIYKVRRTSDNVEFKVGDKIDGIKARSVVIEQIILSEGHMAISYKTGITSLDRVWHAKKPLFTTEDGVEIFEGESYFAVLKGAKDSRIFTYPKAKGEGSNDLLLCFSTKEAAQKYIDSQKVLFRTEDGVDIRHEDRYWYLGVIHTDIIFSSRAHKNNTYTNDRIRFSTEQAAKDYIERNKVLFVTDDGVSIKKGDTYWFVVTSDYTAAHPWKARYAESDWNNPKSPPLGRKQFSTKEAAEEYIIMNKPCLSINDIQSLKKITFIHWDDVLKNLVKDKV